MANIFTGDSLDGHVYRDTVIRKYSVYIQNFLTIRNPNWARVPVMRKSPDAHNCAHVINAKCTAIGALWGCGEWACFHCFFTLPMNA